MPVLGTVLVAGAVANSVERKHEMASLQQQNAQLQAQQQQQQAYGGEER